MSSANSFRPIRRQIVFLLLVLAMPLCAGLDELFARLDLSRPELAEVKQAVEAGDQAGAAAALHRHFRSRQTPKWYAESPPAPAEKPGETDDRAEKILRREYTFVGKTANLTKDLDWNANPLRDNEWTIELNRHYTWVQLVDAYQRTGNPAYAEDFVSQLGDWCADNPRPESPRQARYTWRTLECGIRLSGSWPRCFFAMLHSPHFTPEVMCLMLESMGEQSEFLAKFPAGGNWLVTETSGLMTVAVLFPEFKEAPRWREMCFDRLAREIRNQVPPDGAQVELTPHYHAVTMRSFAAATRIAEFNGIAVPETVGAGIQRMAQYLLDVSKPDLTFPMFNDSDHGSVASALRPYATADHPEFQYVLSRGTEGSAPAYTSVALPYAGQYVMRSGWDEKALYLALDAGPYGAGHQHEDKLHIDVHAHGRSHILDAGRYTYVGGPWRNYFVGTASHSTMLVNGQGQNRRRTSSRRWIGRQAQDNLWLTGETFDFVAGSYEDGYGSGLQGVAHIRKIFFKRGEYWLVHDLLVGELAAGEACTASVQYQFGTTGATAEADGAAIVSHNPDANLAILPVSDRPHTITLHEGEENPPRGWIGWDMHRAIKKPATLAVVHQQASLPSRIDTLLFPYPGTDRPDLRIRRLPEDTPQRSALEITGPDWRDVYHCSHDAADGPRIRWVRHDLAGRELARAEYGDDQAAAPELPVRPLRHALAVTVPADGTVTLDYGFAEGGYLFRREETVKTGENTLRLPSIQPGQSYAYAVRFQGDNGAAGSVRGTFVPEIPTAFDFQDGELGDWANARLVKEGDSTFLRTETKPDTQPTYTHIAHPLPHLKAEGVTFAFKYRTPLADGGDWCYTKLSLTDSQGRRWSAYFATKPSQSWQSVTLQQRDFRRDDGKEGNAAMPEDAVLEQLSVTLRKGKTKEPVPAILELDDVSWTGAE